MMVKIEYRSGLESSVAKWLTSRGVRIQYEKHIIKYYHKMRGMLCNDCGSRDCHAERKYTPDFYLPDYKFFIETKGRFDVADRSMHREILESGGCDTVRGTPDIRFVFQRDNRLTKKSATLYSEWAEAHGRKWSIGFPSEEWF